MVTLNVKRHDRDYLLKLITSKDLMKGYRKVRIYRDSNYLLLSRRSFNGRLTSVLNQSVFKLFRA